VIAVATGNYHLLVVARDPGSYFGKVYSSGANNYGQLGLGDEQERHALTHISSLASENIVNVAAGEYHSLVLSYDRREIYAFGRSDYSQLGIRLDVKDVPGSFETTPKRVYIPEPKPLHFARIDCGDCTSFAITNDYELYSWGFNETGATGHPSIANQDVYILRKLDLSKIKDSLNAKQGDSNVRVHAVGCGGQHTILLVSTKTGDDANASPN
jgi:alpha-tubulin suppressor-like RCC1 family protein